MHPRSFFQRNSQRVRRKIRRAFWPTYKRDLLLWTGIVNPISFFLLPLDFRPILAALVCIPWIAYLSWVGHQTANRTPATS
ncbi:MAG: hypothetical protein COT24_04285 [Candidatus Kerfeldbacteria bacterium CG08_land_8_20_14_0_20_40_16]|uniref:Uncharacterized protein n=1 Tax=Candidatus Kerfeldbacteria bacterium CG08_land_8_20_14_0_20_40_16 TaxID=2014244 RepID=A0A2H0YVJ3_9BACT|nr:MAG: hypothetical protein COT24_04285 [Candidatus Kerfeldbacteria bacterium CG08_land_8_20_14_0_20_40_16]